MSFATFFRRFFRTGRATPLDASPTNPEGDLSPDQFPAAASRHAAPHHAPEDAPREGLRAGVLIVLVIVLAIPAYLLGGMALLSTIDDDPGFYAATEEAKPPSATVDVMARLLEREAGRWRPNDPFFLPGHYLDNMPNYQIGIGYALGRMGLALSDQIGRLRGSSQVDPDLDRAAGLLKYPANIWVLNPLPTASSESQYRKAVEALRSYAARLARGEAVFDRRADNLIAVLDLIAADLGSQSALIDHEMDKGAFAWNADTVFYGTKGRLYAYALLMHALGDDFAPVLKERDMEAVFDQLTATLDHAARLHPAIVLNGRPDGWLPAHLAGQGFYLMRARLQLHELSLALAK